jgi:hypothetical protein
MFRILSPEGRLILADFTKEGFKIMDKIHALEGNTHEVGSVTLVDTEVYLKEKKYQVRNAQSLYQHVQIASRES